MRTLTTLVVLGSFVVAGAASTAYAQEKPSSTTAQSQAASAAKTAQTAVAQTAQKSEGTGPAAAVEKKDAKPAAAAGAKADAKPAADAAQKKPAPPKPEPTGLEKLSGDWPKWLKVNMQYRGRVESVRPVTGTVTAYDGYYMNRLRLSAAVQAGQWVQVVTQIHDVAAMGYATTTPAPTSLSGGFDLRQGYVEIGRKGPRGATVSGGREELSLGDGRLIASPDWGNTSRTYDMGRVSAFLPGFKIDVFRAAPVLVDVARFDRVKPGEYFWGQYVTFDKLPKLTFVDLYAVQKMNSVVTAETGAKGEAKLYTYGARVGGPVTKAVSYDFDAAIQRGHLATDTVSAWAFHGAVSWLVSKSAAKPKLTFEYNFASGDENAKDGAKGTFDQLYASLHAKYGFADLVGWRNMRDYQVKFEVSPTKKLKLNAAINKLQLATVNDSWYNSSGSKVVANTKATSRDIGWEPDLYATVAVSKELSLSAGISVLYPGDYVKQATTLDRYWYPYAMWTVKF
jgi:hypothetical protein